VNLLQKIGTNRRSASKPIESPTPACEMFDDCMIPPNVCVMTVETVVVVVVRNVMKDEVVLVVTLMVVVSPVVVVAV
jgi:hypothetical protein